MSGLGKKFWYGFIINSLAVTIFYCVFEYLAYGRYMVVTDRDLIIILYMMQWVFWGSLAIILIGALFFKLSRTFSVWLMALATLPLMPIGAILLHGILLSNNQARFKQFAPLSKKEPMEWEVITLFNTDKIQITSAILLGSGSGLAYLSDSIVGIFVSSIAAIYLFNGLRLNKCPILAWTSETVVITPNLFSESLLIPPVLIKQIAINDSGMEIDIECSDRIEKIHLKKSHFKQVNLEELEQKFLKYLQHVNQSEVISS